jgi:hypothetical protein
MKIDELNDKVLQQLPLVHVGVAIRRRWVEQVKDMLWIGELSKVIVVEGNEAAHHANEFADGTTWRLGYIKESELDSPLDRTEDLWTQNFKRVFLEVYGKAIDRWATGVPYRESRKHIPSSGKMSNIKATFKLYTSPPASTATVTENEHLLRYRLLCSRHSLEWWKIVNEHRRSKETWSIIDSSPVIVAIIRELKETLSAISQSKEAVRGRGLHKRWLCNTRTPPTPMPIV